MFQYKYDLVNTLLKSTSKLSLDLRIKSKGLTWLESIVSAYLSRLIACTSPIPHSILLKTQQPSGDARLSRKQTKFY